MQHEKSREIADELFTRTEQPDKITTDEFRRLYLRGLSAVVRELDAISYQLKQRGHDGHRY